MKKLSLELDALRVESFATAAPGPTRGTVHGQESAAELTDPVFCATGDPCSGDSVCVCNTTFTARLPECGGDTEVCP